MRLFRVVLRSGTHIDILAKMLVDEPEQSEDLLFYADETGHHLAARVKRAEVAGLILGPPKSSAFPQR